MRHIFWLTLVLLAVGIGWLGAAESIIAPVYHQSLVTETSIHSLPSIVLAALTIAFRKSGSKSAVLLLASAARLGIIYFNCLPIFRSPDDLFFPFLALFFMDAFLFAWMILMLIAAHFLEILRRNQRPI